MITALVLVVVITASTKRILVMLVLVVMITAPTKGY